MSLKVRIIKNVSDLNKQLEVGSMFGHVCLHMRKRTVLTNGCHKAHLSGKDLLEDPAVRNTLRMLRNPKS